MADALKKLRATKASLLQQADEVERDIQDLERLASKYGLAVVETAMPTNSDKTPANGKRRPNEPDPNSLTRRCQAGAEAIIRERGYPVPLSEILSELWKRNVRVTGQHPSRTLSGFLSHSTNVYSILQVGWWVRGLPLPDELVRRGIRGETPLHA